MRFVRTEWSPKNSALHFVILDAVIFMCEELEGKSTRIILLVVKLSSEITLATASLPEDSVMKLVMCCKACMNAEGGRLQHFL